MTGRQETAFWDHVWQVIAILICLATLLIETMGWSGYVPRPLRGGD
jgi:hypothetical protein